MRVKEVLAIAELEENIALTNYIAAERDKGFSDAEIVDKLRAAGWDEAKIKSALKDVNTQQKAKKGKVVTNSFIEKSSAVEQFAKYSPYLAENETVEHAYHIGFYHFLLTNEGLILLRTFPKNFEKIEYKDIELIEYYTFVRWDRLGWFLAIGIITYLYFMLEDVIFEKLADTLPFLRPMVANDIALGFNLIGLLILVALVIVVVTNGITFFSSLFGRIRVIPYREAPIDVITKMTRPVQDFIIEIENKKKHMHEKEAHGED